MTTNKDKTLGEEQFENQMAQISVGDQRLDVESVRAGEETSYQMRVSFRHATGSIETTTVSIDAESRGEITVDRVETALQEWFDAEPSADAIVDFRCRAVDPIKRGEAVAAEQQPDDAAPPCASESDFPFGAGDRIAYYVGGPDSSLYGHLAEAVVEDAPPLVRTKKPDIHDKVKIDTGTQQRPIPVEWVAGAADDPAIDLDRPRPELR